MKIITIVTGMTFLCAISAAQADVCIVLDQNNVGKKGDLTVFTVTAKVQMGTEGKSITSSPIKFGNSYYFNIKNIPEFTALTVKTSTVGLNSPSFELNCINPYIFPAAKSAHLTVYEDSLDPGQCMMSTTASTNPISPCR